MSDGISGGLLASYGRAEPHPTHSHRVPVDGSNMPVDAVGASSDNATGGGARMFAPSANAQYNRTLMNSLQLHNTAIFAFGNDAAIRSEAEALHQAAVTHLQAENREELRVAQNQLHARASPVA